ncbi:MAG: NAD(P)/FAD-dependent oxidoreductase [Methanoregula sp.]|uniref:NAD(P)/FAD-dependent oxidoreductase n=1 Tax=Methanoregula sp. TaxID=2052170 RepID=UPI0025D7695F|nr:NAD(P)/FAD-dependent oxidoreductase [Methanoregula sp.]MCK9631888.1 NAD(P)/FAD-dependent oxidoreductase [Methanoregula sp.]
MEADVVVAGAGPAGLFCAIHAAGAGCRVLLLEKNEKPGAKLLLAGSGQCNLTHDGEIREFVTHYGDHGRFVKPALMSFTNRDLVTFFESRGLAMMTEDSGKVFPGTRRSEDVLTLLLAECKKHGVTIRCSEPVETVSHGGGTFTTTTRTGQYHSGILVITTGGASYPKCGTTGDGYRFAEALGQPVTEIAPALAPLLVRPFPFAGLAGISFERMRFSVWRGGKKLADHTGDVLFTHLGLSGPGILDASRDIQPGDQVRLSFVGEMRREEFAADIAKRAAGNTGWQVSTILAKYPIPERLNRKLLKLSGIPEELKCAHFSAEQRNRLVTNCTEFPLVVERLGEFSVAMATRGGVALDHVSQKTMESRIVPGLFFAGEVLDIDGDTGGYNLQAAFSTGYLAALAIWKKMMEKPA